MTCAGWVLGGAQLLTTGLGGTRAQFPCAEPLLCERPVVGIKPGVSCRGLVATAREDERRLGLLASGILVHSNSRRPGAAAAGPPRVYLAPACTVTPLVA